MNILCVFGGQGGSYSNFFRLFSGYEASASLFAPLAREYGDFLTQEETPLNPYHAQLLIGSLQVLLFNELKPLLHNHRVRLAGYSLGEVSAYLASISASSREVLDTLSFRTQLMTSLLEKTQCSYDLLAIKGVLSQDKLSLLCAQHHCAVAIIPSEQQIVVGGSLAHLEALVSELPTQHRKYARFLNIKLPSHTPLYQEKKGLFAQFLHRFHSKPLKYPILSPLNLAIIDDTDGASELLDKELYTTIQWASLCHLIGDYQFDLIIDLGPSDAMTKLLQTINPNFPIRTSAYYKSSAGFLNQLRGLLNSE